MDKSTKGEKSKEHLVECAAHLFLTKGYNATGINDILKHAGMSKGSFYYYFESKKDLASDVEEYLSKIKKEEIRKAAEGCLWDEFVDKSAASVIEMAKSNRIFGCPFAILGTEIAFSEPDIALRYYHSTKGIADVFKDVLLRSGVPEEKAALMAERAISMFEGYLLFYRISKDERELEKLKRDMKELTNI